MSANTGANTLVGPIQVSNTETIIVPPLSIAGANLANGQIIGVIIAGVVGGPAYDLNIRMGAHGNTTDNVIYSQSNIYSSSFLLNDCATWANNNPGLSPAQYPGPAANAVSPGLVLNGGEFFLVAANVGTHAFLQIVDASGTLGNTQYVANSSTFDSTVQQNLSVSHAVSSQPSLAWVGQGAGSANTPHGNSYKLTAAGKPQANSVITLGKVQIVSLPT